MLFKGKLYICTVGLWRGKVEKSLQAECSGWGRVSRVIFDRWIAARDKGKIPKMLVRPAIMHWQKDVRPTWRWQSWRCYWRFLLGATRMDTGTAHEWFGVKLMRQSWDGAEEGECMWKDVEDAAARQEENQRWFIDVVKEDMQRTGVTEDDAVEL